MDTLKDFFFGLFQFLKKITTYSLLFLWVAFLLGCSIDWYEMQQHEKERLCKNKQAFVEAAKSIDKNLHQNQLDKMYDDLLGLDGFPDIKKDSTRILEVSIVDERAINTKIKYRPYADLAHYEVLYSANIYYDNDFNIVGVEENTGN